MAVDYVTEVKLYPGNGDNLLGRGSFVVAECLAINFSIFRGKDGTPRLVLPSSPNPNFDASKPMGKDNKKFYDEVRPISPEARQELEALILSKLEGSDNPIPF